VSTGKMETVTLTRSAGSALDPIALSMLLVSLAVSVTLAAVKAPVLDAGLVPVMVVLTLAAAAWRVWLMVRSPDIRVRRAGFWIGLLAGCLLVMISPVYGLYAFLGYMEAPIIARGVQRSGATVITAAACALAQIGGPRSSLWSWPLYGLLLAVNVGIALLIMLVERRRERVMLDLERTVAELSASEDRNVRLQDQLLAQARDAGVQEERARLSREIHDTVAQSLVGIITQLEAASDITARDHTTRLQRAGATARDALGEARRAVRALASPRLDDDQLPTALAGFVREIAEATSIDARFTLDGEPAPTPYDAELLRICQEALTNVAKHSTASRVMVTLGYSADAVRLDVRDDGSGFDAAVVRSGHGLPGIRQRLANIGGMLEIETSEGGGCAVSAAVPR
jgi:signal transduction histidine kinase